MFAHRPGLPSSMLLNSCSTRLTQPLTSLVPISSSGPIQPSRSSAIVAMASATFSGPYLDNKSTRCIKILRVMALATGLSISSEPSKRPSCGIDFKSVASSKSCSALSAASSASLSSMSESFSTSLSAHSANSLTSLISLMFLLSLASIGITLSILGSTVSCTNNSFKLLVSVSSSINGGVQLSKYIL